MSKLLLLPARTRSRLELWRLEDRVVPATIQVPGGGTIDVPVESFSL